MFQRLLAGRNPRPAPVHTDSDVAGESERVVTEMMSLIQRDSVTMVGLHRRFGNFTAVESLDLSIAPGETFGLLGVNGAGKTTTFNMLTGETGISGGQAFLHGFDVTSQLRQAQKLIGYCPQFDALIGEYKLPWSPANYHLTLFLPPLLRTIPSLVTRNLFLKGRRDWPPPRQNNIGSVLPIPSQQVT